MTHEKAQAFARHGGEKMVYDMRMGPMSILHDDTLYAVYPANPEGPAAHPHIVTYDMSQRAWSEPVRLGAVPFHDHHFNPVLWLDPEERIHALYGCHGRGGSVHIVSREPRSIDAWEPAPRIAPSITYPHVIPMADGRMVMYHRVFIHLGYWTYRISEDGGFTWRDTGPLVDMDQRPESDQDTWSGSYHSVWPSVDRRSLHIAFVRLDEARRVNPRYNNRFVTNAWLNKYDLHYGRLDLDSGILTNIEGEELELPLNRPEAERCKVWDSDWRLTNVPALHIDADDQPHMMLPVSGESPWHCTFHYVRREDGEWALTPVADSNIPWSSSLFRQGDDGLRVYLVRGGPYGETVPYGGGTVQEWASPDGGHSWEQIDRLVPVEGLIYNNPRWVQRLNGEPVEDMITLFGWKGPGGIHETHGTKAGPRNRGQAFLWHRGEWL